jgi:N-methylhydantoinase A
MTELSLSADIGGTFTDVVRLDAETGEVVVGKSPTTHASPAEGIIAALESTRTQLESASRFLHGTTVGMNTLLERSGATVGLITTAGFEDILEIRRASWPPYRLVWDKPVALVPRQLCVGLSERILVGGEVRTPLDLDEAARALDELAGQGVDAIAVCLINSYADPRHEQLIGELATSRHPGLSIALSHQVTRRYREYERTVTTVAEAYIRPRMTAYFSRLADGLSESGFQGELYITTSDGGVMSVEDAHHRILRSLVSGAASGIAGAASLGAACGYPDLIAIDMGGTSFDAGLVRHGQPEMSPTSEVAGLTMLLPMIDLATIGAGGGSVAWVDDAGGLNVGPQSAGAVPGPACYGRGGERPTFSDAALVTGLLPDSLLGGEMSLSVAAAEAAILQYVASPLGLELKPAASGIVALIETKMARTLEEITIGNGHDPRDFTLFAYGGGGPIVASALADLLGVRTIVVPRHPGVFSAWGMQTLDVVHEFSHTSVALLNEPDDVLAPFEEPIEDATVRLERERVPADDRILLRFIELRYDGQEHTLLVPVSSESVDTLTEHFEQLHEQMYGFRLDRPVEIVGYRVRAIGRLPKPAIPRLATGTDETPIPVAYRTVDHWTSKTQNVPWPIYERASLGANAALDGPAIIEEMSATTVVTPGRSLRVDDWGNLVIEVQR